MSYTFWPSAQLPCRTAAGPCAATPSPNPPFAFYQVPAAATRKPTHDPSFRPRPTHPPRIDPSTPTAPQLLSQCGDLLEDLTSQLTSSAVTAGGAAAVNVWPVMECMTTLDMVSLLIQGRPFGTVRDEACRVRAVTRGLVWQLHSRVDRPARRILRAALRLPADARPAGEAELRAEWEALHESAVGAALEAPPGEHTLLGQLLETRDPATGAPLTRDQLKSEVVFAMLAGFETAALTCTWALAALAAHPEALRKLEAELASAGLLGGADAGGAAPPPRFGWEHLGGKLPYLQAIMKETFPMFQATGNGSVRTIARDTQLRPGLTLPAGTTVMAHAPLRLRPQRGGIRPDRGPVPAGALPPGGAGQAARGA